jgi:hypothetical protein
MALMKPFRTSGVAAISIAVAVFTSTPGHAQTAPAPAPTAPVAPPAAPGAPAAAPPPVASIAPEPTAPTIAPVTSAPPPAAPAAPAAPATSAEPAAPNPINPAGPANAAAVPIVTEVGVESDVVGDHDSEDPKEPQKPEDFGGSTGDPWGDGQKGIGIGPLSLRFLLQTRYVATFAEPSTNSRASYVVREENIAQDGDGWKVNRLFLRLAAEPNPHLGAKMILDFAELINDNADSVVKQAYVTLRPFPKRLEIQAGVFKTPFSIMELDAIAQYTLADLGPSDSLIKNLGFGGKDIGIMVTGSPLPKKKLLRASLGIYRGHSKDEHDSPFGTIGGRLESHPIKGLRLGADWVEQPFDVTYNRPFETGSKDELPAPPDPLYPRSKSWSRGRAWSADVTFQRWKLLLQAEAMIGNRTDVDWRYGAETFAGIWALASYRFKVGPISLMPALKAEFLDADREHRTGLRRVYSAGMNVIFTKSVRVLLDVTRTDVDPQSAVLDPPRPVVIPPFYDLDNTRVTGQLQVAM